MTSYILQAMKEEAMKEEMDRQNSEIKYYSSQSGGENILIPRSHLIVSLFSLA